jgi:hypothetical protein
MKVVSSKISSPIEKLKTLYKRRRLTQCLSFLESQGIEGDVAIFLLSSLSVGGKA